MTLRSARERVAQTLAFETLGLCIVAPIHAQLFETSAEESFLLIAVLAVAVTLWSPLFNTAFDRCDLALTGRVASDRPQGLRVVHASLLETTALIISVPLVMVLTGLGFLAALTLDLALTVFYVGYAYLFHNAYDRLLPIRPVPPASAFGLARANPAS